MHEVPVPGSSSRPLDARKPDILLGREPERQREVDSICGLIERLAAAGIPAAKYNLTLLGIPRTAREPGRGGSRNAAFRGTTPTRTAPPGRAGIVSAEENWARIDPFSRGGDPGADRRQGAPRLPSAGPCTPTGYRGVTSVLGTVDGLKRFVTMHESPYHGLNFCQGTVAEMLDDPGARDLRRDRAGSASAEAVQRPFPQHQGPQARFRRGLSG